MKYKGMVKRIASFAVLVVVFGGISGCSSTAEQKGSPGSSVTKSESESSESEGSSEGTENSGSAESVGGSDEQTSEQKLLHETYNHLTPKSLENLVRTVDSDQMDVEKTLGAGTVKGTGFIPIEKQTGSNPIYSVYFLCKQPKESKVVLSFYKDEKDLHIFLRVDACSETLQVLGNAKEAKMGESNRLKITASPDTSTTVAIFTDSRDDD